MNQPSPYAAPPPTPGNNVWKILLPILAVLVLAAGAVLGYMYSQQPQQTQQTQSDTAESDAKKTDKLDYDPELIDAVFTEGKLSDCELGDDFFDSVGVIKVWTTTAEETQSCGGEYEVEEGTVPISMTVESSDAYRSSTFPIRPSDGPKDWEEQISGGPEEYIGCVMFSNRPELSRVKLVVYGPCTLAHPLATGLNNLANDYVAHTTGGTPEHVDPNPQLLSASSEEYKRLVEDAKRPGESIDGVTLEHVEQEFRARSGDNKLRHLCVELPGANAKVRLLYANSGVSLMEPVADEEGKFCALYIGHLDNHHLLVHIDGADEAWKVLLGEDFEDKRFER